MINHEFINYSLEDKKVFKDKKLFQGFPLLIENKALLNPSCKSFSIPATHKTNEVFKATTLLWALCPEPFKTDFRIFSFWTLLEAISFSFEIFS